MIWVRDGSSFEDMAALSCVFRKCPITTVTSGNIPLGSLCQMPDEGLTQLQVLSGYLKRTVSRQPGSVMYIHHSG